MKIPGITFGGICVLPAVFLSVFYLSACQSEPAYSSALVTPKGVKAEALLPADSFVVVKLGTTDPIQVSAIQDLIKLFPQDSVKKFEDELMAAMNEGLAESGLSFSDDILPVLGISPEVIAAVAGKHGENDEPDIVIAVKVDDGQKAEALMEKLAKSGFEKQTYRTFDIYVENSNRAYMTLYNDVLLITNRIALIQKGIDGATASNGTLLQDPVYQKGLMKMKDTSGFFWFGVQTYFAGDATVTDNPVLKGLEAEMAGVKAEKEGLRVRFIVYGDEKLLKESRLSFIDAQSEPAYLYKNINEANLILYFEGYALGSLIEMQSEAYKSMEGFEDLSEGIDSFMSGVGIDAEKDLAAFMDRGYALFVSDNGTSVPTLALVWDVTSDAEGAKKVSGAIYNSIEKLLDSLDEETSKVITHDEAADGYILNINLKEMNGAEESDGVSPDSLKFSYAVTADNLFYVGLNFNGFGTGGTGTALENDAKFVKARNSITGFDRGLLYFEMDPMLKYADRIVENTVKSGAMSEEDRQNYEIAKSFLSHLKMVIFGNAKATADSVETQGFIRIE